MEGMIIGTDYQLTKKLKACDHEELWQAVHQKTKEPYIVKIHEKNIKANPFYNETRVYMLLNADPSSIGQAIPRVFNYGDIENNKEFMILEAFGQDLETLFQQCGKKFSLKTVLMCADQILKRIEFIHSRRIIHRDINPNKLAIGVGLNQNRLYLFDFSLVKRYIDSKGKHIEYKENKHFTGTPRFASLNTHLGIEQSRRDDLEQIGNVLVYFLKGSLPWQGLQAENLQQIKNQVKEKKMNTTIEELCHGLPEEFAKYYNYCRSLEFTQEPDYKYLRGLFKDLCQKLKFEFDFAYDWTKIDPIEQQ